MVVNSNEESEHFCPVANLREKAFVLFLLRIMLAVDFSQMFFIRLRQSPSYFLRVFIINDFELG